ncbi:uncharacterized protein [Watersipora subatra]|uniref:uncharacterized protein n=1 Tax=Watersipora subatra TaxID=2589382 RepID=UPI00355C6201
MVRAWLKSRAEIVADEGEEKSTTEVSGLLMDKMDIGTDAEKSLLLAVEQAGVKLNKLEKIDDFDPKDFTQRFDITLTDSVATNQPLGDLSQEAYEAELARYRRPHFHFTDEMRLIKDGSCYIDIQITDQKWARLYLSTGDQIIIPAGVFHSISLGKNWFVKASGYYKSRGLENEYLPRYDYDVKTLIPANERRCSQFAATSN